MAEVDTKQAFLAFVNALLHPDARPTQRFRDLCNGLALVKLLHKYLPPESFSGLRAPPRGGGVAAVQHVLQALDAFFAVALGRRGVATEAAVDASAIAALADEAELLRLLRLVAAACFQGPLMDSVISVVGQLPEKHQAALKIVVQDVLGVAAEEEEEEEPAATAAEGSVEVEEMQAQLRTDSQIIDRLRSSETRLAEEKKVLTQQLEEERATRQRVERELPRRLQQAQQKAAATLTAFSPLRVAQLTPAGELEAERIAELETARRQSASWEEQNKQLQRALDSKSAELQRQNRKMEQLMLTLATSSQLDQDAAQLQARIEHEQVVAKLQRAKEELQAERQHREQLEAQNAQQAEKISKLEHEVRAGAKFKQLSEQFRTELARETTRVAAAEEEKQRQSAEIERLAALLAEKDSALENSKCHIVDIEAQLQAVEKAQKDAVARISELELSLCSIKAKLEVADKDRKELASRIEGYDAHIEELQAALDDARQTVSKLQQQRQQSIDESQAGVAREKQAFEAQLSEAKQHSERLIAANGELAHRIQDATERMEDLAEENRTLKFERDDLQELLSSTRTIAAQVFGRYEALAKKVRARNSK